MQHRRVLVGVSFMLALAAFLGGGTPPVEAQYLPCSAYLTIYSIHDGGDWAHTVCPGGSCAVDTSPWAYDSWYVIDDETPTGLQTDQIPTDCPSHITRGPISVPYGSLFKWYVDRDSQTTSNDLYECDDGPELTTAEGDDYRFLGAYCLTSGGTIDKDTTYKYDE